MASWEIVSEPNHLDSRRETMANMSTSGEAHKEARNDSIDSDTIAHRAPSASSRLIDMFRGRDDTPSTSSARPVRSRESDASPRTSTSSTSSSLMNMWLGAASSSSASNAIEGGDNQSTSKDKWGAKMRSAWNNVRYGWSFNSMGKFEIDSPIWLLGRFYHAKRPKDTNAWSSAGGGMMIENGTFDIFDDTDFQEFYGDFTSRIWLTYRSNFPRIGRSSVTTDCGWGCMLRSMQMMTAQALLLHNLGRDWNYHAPTRLEVRRAHRQIVRLFADDETAPLSVHRMVLTKLKQDRTHALTTRHTERYSPTNHLANAVNLSTSTTDMNGDSKESKENKHVRRWYGPASAAFLMRDNLNEAAQSAEYPILTNMRTYVATDCCVCLAEVNRLALEPSLKCLSPWETVFTCAPSTSSSDPPPTYDKLDRPPAYTEAKNMPWRNAMFIVIPLRLGGEHINPIYAQHLKTLFSLNKFCGVAGGKPKHSMYFCGWHDDELIFMDPHLSQEADKTLISCDIDEVDVSTYHCRYPRLLPFAQMDPSCAVGFYVRSRAELMTLLDELSDVINYSPTSTQSPTTESYKATRPLRKNALFSVVENSDQLFQRQSAMPTIRRFVGTRKTSASFNGSPNERCGMSPSSHDDFEIL